jgi:thiosulfate reductase cytochrome b subunit
MTADATLRRRSRWIHLAWIIPVALVVAALIVLAAQWLRAQPAGQDFLASYPGQSALPAGAPVGFPAWLQWQHGLSAFLLLFIVRSGWTIRTQGRPDTFWVRRNDGRIRTKGQPIRITLMTWFHLSLDVLWILNGAVFYVLLFATGQWMRVVPVHWDVVPNALSALLQYASLDWPVANGWANYNALQLVTYFGVIFLLAPLAILTGLRLTPGLSVRWRRLDRAFPLRVAARIHVIVLVLLVVFVAVHVFLVFATGALHNLNHMWAGRDDASWIGAIVFAAFVVVCVVGWFAFSPVVLRAIAGTMGAVRRR